MKWCFVNSEPLTTEKERRVFNARGEEGVVSIRHEGGRPQPYGGVRTNSGKLDPFPTFVLARELD